MRSKRTLSLVAGAIALVGLWVFPAGAQLTYVQPGSAAPGRPSSPPMTQVGETPAGQPLPPAGPFAGIEVLATPYLWLTWNSFDVRPADTRIARRSGTVDPLKLIEHLSWVPFMGEAEFRSGPYAVLLDYIHAPVRAGFGTRDIVFGSHTFGSVVDSGTAMFLYRALAQPEQYVDVGMGIRAWGLSGDIALSQGLLPPVSVVNGLSWADPMIAARYHRGLGNGFGAAAYGDFGGFGLGAHVDWQVVGTIDYACGPGIDLHAGFRSLNFSYGAPTANVQVHMYGPILAATFRF